MRTYAAIVLTALLTSGCVIKKPANNDPEPAAAPAQEQAAAPAPYVPPVPDAPAKVTFGNGCTVGWTATQEMETAAGKQVTSWAIVGDMGQTWQVECILPGLPADNMLALTVTKADGMVTRAMLGKKGEAGVEHKIAAAPPAAVEGVPGKCTIKIGSFDAKKFDNGGGNISWIGEGGDLNGVLLKMEGAAPFELSGKPSSDYVPVSGTSLAVTSYKYSNGMTYLVTNDRIVAAFFPYEVGKRGLFGMEMQGMKSKITMVGSSAKPQMMW